MESNQNDFSSTPLRLQRMSGVVAALYMYRQLPVQEQTLHHINRAKPFMENSAMARLRDILRGWGPADP